MLKILWKGKAEGEDLFEGTESEDAVGREEVINSAEIHRRQWRQDSLDSWRSGP